VPLEEDAEHRSEVLTPEEALIHSETQVEVRKMVADLPDKYRDVVTFFYLQRRSHQEIAALLNIEVTSVATRLQRAKAMMQERMGEEGTAHGRTACRASTDEVS